MRVFLDTNVIVRHLTGDPPVMAAAATPFLAELDGMLMPGLVVAEVVSVLESFYEVDRVQVAALLRSVLAFRTFSLSTRDCSCARSRCTRWSGWTSLRRTSWLALRRRA